MASLKQIKGKIRSTDRTHKVTKAMEAVSAVKMRHGQAAALAGRPYAAAAVRVLKRVTGAAGDTHPLTVRRNRTRATLIAITSDKGLAGSLNAAVLKAARAHLAERELNERNTDVIAIGRKAAEYFENRGFTLRARYENVRDDVPGAFMRDMLADARLAFERGESDSVIVAYMNFVSTFEQCPVVREVLPLSLEELEGIVAGIGEHEPQPAPTSVYTVEPSEEAVYDELVPFLLQVVLYHALLEAKASEHSARMVAMKSASDKSSEKSSELTLEYNKIRQAVITREISEIVGGIEAMTH